MFLFVDIFCLWWYFFAIYEFYLNIWNLLQYLISYLVNSQRKKKFIFSKKLNPYKLFYIGRHKPVLIPAYIQTSKLSENNGSYIMVVQSTNFYWEDCGNIPNCCLREITILTYVQVSTCLLYTSLYRLLAIYLELYYS